MTTSHPPRDRAGGARASAVGARALPVILLAALAACSGDGPATRDPGPDELNVIDSTDLNEVMLAVADPGEAVAHFERTSRARPNDPAVRRGLATSLMRADRAGEAVPVWRSLAADAAGTSEDRVSLAEALIRTGDWDGARAALDTVPPTHETARRYRLEAMAADAAQDWGRADSFYEIAAGLSPQPAGVLNNWGYSKLSRGAPEEGRSGCSCARWRSTPRSSPPRTTSRWPADRGGVYDLPLVPMTQTERAQLLHTLALSAVKSGDVATARALLRDAIETHPQHFEAATRALAALEQPSAAL